MSKDERDRNEGLNAGAAIRSNWGWFVILGVVLAQRTAAGSVNGDAAVAADI